MQEAKELSEHELAALGAVVGAVDPFNVNFVRSFQKTQETTEDGLKTCRVWFKFGFRRLDTDDGGTADAEVLLKRILVADSIKLAHHYFVWVPFSVSVTVRVGQSLVPAHANSCCCPLGNGSHTWFVLVRHLPETVRA